MISVADTQNIYLAHFRQLAKRANGRSWLDAVRADAMEHFIELGFPTTRQEEWKQTNVAPIARTEFEAAQPATVGAHELAGVPLLNLDSTRIVFVNGYYSAALSSLAPKDEIRVGSLAAALQAGASNGNCQIEQHLARYARYQEHAFVALNMALMEDGAIVEIPKGLVLEKPVVMQYIWTASDQPSVSHPRNLVIAGPESQATIIEAHIGLGDGVSFTNAVTEIAAGEGAVITYVKLQQERTESYHVATIEAHLDRSSNVATHSIALGGALVREEVRTVLDGEGAEALLDGLYMIGGTQHVDNHTTIDHAKPHCSSRELYKGVLDGKASGVFNGKIIVRKDAQKTDSKQSNKNLLLSEDAVINTKPQLEIYADDVKCTHGATIGQIDQEAIFYLRSRGIGLEEARKLLIEAFANDVIGRVKYEPLRAGLQQILGARFAASWQ